MSYTSESSMNRLDSFDKIKAMVDNLRSDIEEEWINPESMTDYELNDNDLYSSDQYNEIIDERDELKEEIESLKEEMGDMKQYVLLFFTDGKHGSDKWGGEHRGEIEEWDKLLEEEEV